MTSAVHFRFSTEILRRLGEELNPSPDQGIIELVKNAYDADARKCTIQLTNTEKAGGSISIVDDGDGMTERDVTSGWLVLGSSTKSTTKPTRLGRIPAGSKGLGRLAALRMGKRVTLITRPRSSGTTQYKLDIDWAKFENAKMVDEVDLVINKTKRTIDQQSGTEITIFDLNSAIDRGAVKRLARALILLADPFGDDPSSFRPELIATEFSDLENLVRNRYFEDAEYHLIAEVNDAGQARAVVVDWRGEELFSASHEDLSVKQDQKLYASPPARFDLWVFILNRKTFSTRSSTVGQVREWLSEFGGVHLYQNGLRVSPYGNPGNDWLDMNLRRARSPEERPSTNTSIGRVSIHDNHDLLVQKTDRSGFIESFAFLELRTFAQDAMDWMAGRRLELAEQRRATERLESKKSSSKSQKRLEEAIESAPEELRAQLKVAYSAREKSRDREIENLRKDVQLYRTLSTAGITAATFAHESSGNPIKVITQCIKTVERRAKSNLGEQYAQLVSEPIEQIKRAMDSLAVLGSFTLKLLDHDKRRVGHVEIHQIITNIIATFQPFLEGRDVRVTVDLCPGKPFLRGTVAGMESILTNLLNNSLAAFEYSASKERNMILRTEINDNILALRVLDNGPGIKGINTKDVWLPGRTTRPRGTGLGLTIVKDAVIDLGGQVNAIANGELGGAEFIIELPILGA